MALGSRVKTAREKLNLTQTELAEKVGISQQAIHMLEQRDSKSSKFLHELSVALNVSTEWLKTGYPSIKENNATYNVTPVPKELLEKRQDVPLLTWVSAGAWLNNQGSFTEADAERWLPCPTAHSKMTFALTVQGDSMTSPYPHEKSYPNGTIIYVDPNKQFYNGCRVIALLHTEQAYTFKCYVEDAGRKYLNPLNPTYKSILITPDIEIIGVVIGAFID